MNNNRLSGALGEIHERYLEEYLQYRPAGSRRAALRRRARRWGGTAACLCLLLAAVLLVKAPVSRENAPGAAAPGFLTVTAYAAASDETITMEEGAPLPLDYRWSPAMSSRPGLPLTLSAPDRPDAVFDVSAEGGGLLL